MHAMTDEGPKGFMFSQVAPIYVCEDFPERVSSGQDKCALKGSSHLW